MIEHGVEIKTASVFPHDGPVATGCSDSHIHSHIPTCLGKPGPHACHIFLSPPPFPSLVLFNSFSFSLPMGLRVNHLGCCVDVCVFVCLYTRLMVGRLGSKSASQPACVFLSPEGKPLPSAALRNSHLLLSSFTRPPTPLFSSLTSLPPPHLPHLQSSIRRYPGYWCHSQMCSQ